MRQNAMLILLSLLAAIALTSARPGADDPLKVEATDLPLRRRPDYFATRTRHSATAILSHSGSLTFSGSERVIRYMPVMP